MWRPWPRSAASAASWKRRGSASCSPSLHQPVPLHEEEGIKPCFLKVKTEIRDRRVGGRAEPQSSLQGLIAVRGDSTITTRRRRPWPRRSSGAVPPTERAEFTAQPSSKQDMMTGLLQPKLSSVTSDSRTPASKHSLLMPTLQRQPSVYVNNQRCQSLGRFSLRRKRRANWDPVS